MTEPITVTSVTISAASKVLDSFFEEIEVSLKRTIANEVAKWRTRRRTERLSRHIVNVRMVKTLWQIDRPVDLADFYYHTHVYVNNVRRKVIYLGDLGNSNRIVVQGIAGQGKSIFLRFLSSMELMRGEFLPIFVEIRRIALAQPVKEFLLDTMQSYGIEISDDLFKHLAESGRLLFLLDGFDEIQSGYESRRVLIEIERLTKQFENLRIVITSRPDAGIEVATAFEVVRVSNLEGNDFKEVMRRILPESDLVDNLISQIERHSGRVGQLLQTPLLVTMLVIHYKAFQSVPDQLSDFYESLFQILMQRHDGTKAGYKRRRTTDLNDTNYRKIFEVFCFNSKRLQTPFTAEDAVGLCVQALSEMELIADPEKLLSDFVRITCLILREGNCYTFVHKSVQEYYSASYVRRQSDGNAKRFYFNALRNEEMKTWGQEVAFLCEIDTYRFQKYGLLPLIQEMTGFTESEFDSGPRFKEAVAVKFKEAIELEKWNYINICVLEQCLPLDVMHIKEVLKDLQRVVALQDYSSFSREELPLLQRKLAMQLLDDKMLSNLYRFAQDVAAKVRAYESRESISRLFGRTPLRSELNS